MKTYKDELTRSMEYLAASEKTFFIGQAVSYQGTAMRGTLENVNEKKLLEMPVEEDFQMGVANGLALQGYIPISIFPRWNFLLLATNQIVNHLNCLRELTGLKTPPKVIIRTSVGSETPLHPGPQHVGDFTEAFRQLCPNLEIVNLQKKSLIFPSYEKALCRTDGVSTLLVEWGDKYGQ